MLTAGVVGRALVAGLCVAAAAAIFALVAGDFDEGHWRIVLTSLGFSITTAFAGAGDALRVRARSGSREALVGAATMALAAATYLIALVLIWIDESTETDALWRAFAITGLLTLCGSHASLVLRARRRADPPLIRALVAFSIGGIVLDTLVLDVGILGAIDDVSDGVVRGLAVVLVLSVLATLLPPILRALQNVPDRRVYDAFGRQPEPEALGTRELAEELAAAADRLDAVTTPDEARREAAALRDLAARAR
jgi:hypothetical protein